MYMFVWTNKTHWKLENWKTLSRFLVGKDRDGAARYPGPCGRRQLYETPRAVLVVARAKLPYSHGHQLAGRAGGNS